MATELDVQRNLTDWFIRTRPIELVLTPRDYVSDGAGGWTWVTGAPRTAQTLRMIESNDKSGVGNIVRAADGTQREVEMELLGAHDSLIEADDTFSHQGGDWLVLQLFYDNDWSVRAQVARYGQ